MVLSQIGLVMILSLNGSVSIITIGSVLIPYALIDSVSYGSLSALKDGYLCLKEIDKEERLRTKSTKNEIEWTYRTTRSLSAPSLYGVSSDY